MDNLKNKEIFNLGKDLNNNDIYIKEGDYKCNPHLIFGRNGSGKSVFMENLIKNTIENNEPNLIIDYINNSTLAQKLSKYSQNIISIDLKNIDLLSIDFREINILYHDLDYRNILLKTELTKTLLNSLSEEPLTNGSMRIIENTCSIVYSQHNNTFKDFIEFLLDCNYRSKIINEIKEFDIKDEAMKLQIQESLYFIDNINEYDDEENIVGTKFSKFENLYNRINKVKQSYVLTKITNSDNSFKFSELINNNTTIIVNLPKNQFSIEDRNFISCLILENIILSSKNINYYNLNEIKRINIFIDEIDKTTKIQDTINNILYECRPLGLKFLLIATSLTNFNNQLLNNLKSYRTNISIVHGFNDTHNIINEFTYNYDNYNLNKYESIHFLLTDYGYDKIVTKLPKPL